MDDTLLTQFHRWKTLDRQGRPDFIEYLKTANPWILAHHPADSCFREHVWKVNGLYLCKGCMVTAAGFVAGLGLQAATGWLGRFPEEALGLAFALLLLPTLLSTTFQWPRAVRHVSRFLLGVLIASALLLLFVTERWEVRTIVILTYVVVKNLYEAKRRRQNDQLLANCRHHGPVNANGTASQGGGP